MIEIGVVDIAGQTLFESLVNPGCPISAEATAVHGIVDSDVAEAPTLLEVLPRLLEVIEGRPLLAYNAPYDRQVLAADLESRQRRSKGLTAPRRWGCVMRARSAATGNPWARLEGDHRAVGDAQAAAEVLRAIAAGLADSLAQAPCSRSSAKV